MSTRLLVTLLLVACVHSTELRAAAPSIAAGYAHSLALHADGTVRAWGDDTSGQLGLGRTLLTTRPVAVAGIDGVVRVAGGGGHVLALRSDGTVWAWGRNDSGQLGDGLTANRSTPAPVAGLANVVAISAGEEHSMALGADGTVWIWGRIDQLRQLLPTPVPGLPIIVEISAGTNHRLARDRDGRVWAWGSNDYGQLGDGTTGTNIGRSSVALVLGLASIVSISAGGDHSLAVRADGVVFAWGWNGNGQLGDGSYVDRNSPIPIPGAGDGVAVSAGYLHSLVLRRDGSVSAWGWGIFGELGDGRFSDSSTPVPVFGLANGASVSAGGFYSAARTADGAMYTWGRDDRGQLGDGSTSNIGVPKRVAGLPLVVDISASRYPASNVFAVGSDGVVRAWGENDYGQLGDGVRPARSTPAAVPGLAGITRIAGGGSHSLALKSDGTTMAWGDNYYGQLGDGTRVGRSSPLPAIGLTGIVDIAAGRYLSLALKSDGTLWCWGWRYPRPFGPPPSDEIPILVPSPVEGISTARAVSVTVAHTLVLLSDGTVRAFGENGGGALGDGTTTFRYSPVVVSGLAGVSAIAAGDGFSLALRDDGTVWSWGYNNSGQLGDGSRQDRVLPAQIPGLSGVVAISANGNNGFAIRSDGTVWGWGANSPFGQVGNGSGVDEPNPVPLPGLANMATISAGAYGALALKSDGLVFGWGSNGHGQVGDGTFATRAMPVVVVREDGAGTLEANNWFLDLNPALPKSIPGDRIPVFLTVANNTAGGITATLQFRGQDLGATSSVFAFAVAPASSVLVAKGGEPPLVVGYAKSRDGRKDTSVACVLAQLTTSGQLQGVSAAALQAYVTGVLTAQGQAVTIINGVTTANIGGATFYVGYGGNGASMINGGTNRSVVSVPGDRECKPQAPQTGWWWNTAEGGRGYSVEVAGNHIFYAAFLYDDTGRSNWYVATGNTSIDGSLFTGDLLRVSGGQSLAGTYHPPTPAQSIGPFTLAFSDATHGTMVWPSATEPTVAIERFNIVPNGLNAAPKANQPESGWWWNPAESGRGFFIEWQDGNVDLAGYMYDDNGNSVWYLSVFPTPDIRTFSGNWWLYGGGQAISAAYKPATRINDNVAPVTISFTSSTTATMTLPNGRTTALQRHRF